MIGSSWYVACYMAGRFGFLSRQIGSENLGRFLGSLGRMPFTYYAVPLIFNSAPLSTIAPIAVVCALSRKPASIAAASETKRANEAVRLLAIFWIVTVILFSIAAYKR